MKTVKEIKKAVAGFKIAKIAKEMPILNCIKFEYGNGILTNLDETLIIKDCHAESDFVINLKVFNMLDDNITLEYYSINENKLKIKNYNLNLEDFGSFPNTLANIDNVDFMFYLNYSNELKQALQFVCKDSNRPVFKTVKITERGFASSDGKTIYCLPDESVSSDDVCTFATETVIKGLELSDTWKVSKGICNQDCKR